MIRKLAARLRATFDGARVPAHVTRPRFVEAMESRTLLSVATVRTGPANPSSVSEGTEQQPGQTIYFPINLDNGDMMTTRVYTVNFTITGTATPGVDHTHAATGSMTLTLTGMMHYASGTVAVTPKPDLVNPEPTETVIFTITSITGGASGGQIKSPSSTYGTSTATIANTAPPNQAPSVDAGSGVADEGPGNVVVFGGGFSDPDGHAVTISASAGAVSQTYGSSGSYTVTLPAADGPLTTSVVVTATDNGSPPASSQATGTAIVNNVAPTFTPTGPSQVFAGDLYSMQRPSVTDPGQDTISGWTVAWGDGTSTSYPGDAASFSHVYGGPGQVRNISVTATDEDGSYTAGTSVQVVLPTVSVSAEDAVATEGVASDKGTLILYRNGGSYSALTVRYKVRNPSPVEAGVANDDDYTIPGSAAAGTGTDAGWTFRTVTFAAGATSVAVDLTAATQPAEEGDETVTAAVAPDGTAPDDYTPASGTAAVVIKDMPVVDLLAWEGVVAGDGQSNFSVDNPTDMGGGARLFPDRNTPGGAQHNDVRLVVKLIKPVVSGQVVSVHVKLFDVDDPTAFGNVVDSNDVPAGVAAATNLYKGGDNRGAAPGALPAVTVPAGQDTATFVFTLPAGARAGDNYRAFASTDLTVVNTVQVDEQAENGKTLINPFRIGTDSNNKPPITWSSATLSVWRKLHLEVDQMQAGTTGENRHVGNVTSAAWNGTHTVLTLPAPNPDFNANSQFEDGWIEIESIGGSAVVASIVTSPTTIDVSVARNLTANPLVQPAGKLFHLYDDDIRPDANGVMAYRTTLRDPDTSMLKDSLKPAFFEPVYLETSDAQIGCDRNIINTAGELVQLMDADRQHPSTVVSDTYITAHLVSAFQGEPQEDGDPSSEFETLGTTAPVAGGAFLMASVIFQEVHRDVAYSEAETVVHEIGHLFERPGVDSPFHGHGGVMNINAIGTTTYAAETPERIRSRNFTAP